MSSEWFCKVGEKKFGPLSGQQLKTIVAKGKLRPEHLVRRGSEGPWVPAGRIKGLFPEGTAGNAQSAGKKPPKAKATSLPTAAEAPAPPPADIPQELRLGAGHKHHVQMNVNSLNFDTTPVDVSRRKLKTGLKGLKKEEQKKLTIMLMCLIGGGTTFGLIVLIWAFATGKFTSTKPEEKPNLPAALAQAADSGKAAEKVATEKKPLEEKEPATWSSVGVKMPVGNVEVNVLKPTRSAPPPGAKTKEPYVLVVPVTLQLKGSKTKPVELTSWTDASLKKKVSLKDDKGTPYDLLEQVADKDSDGKAITERRIKVQLVFEGPNVKALKFLRLTLPAAAFHVDGTLIGYEIRPSDIRPRGRRWPRRTRPPTKRPSPTRTIPRRKRPRATRRSRASPRRMRTTIQSDLRIGRRITWRIS